MIIVTTIFWICKIKLILEMPLTDSVFKKGWFSFHFSSYITVFALIITPYFAYHWLVLATKCGNKMCMKLNYSHCMTKINIKFQLRLLKKYQFCDKVYYYIINFHSSHPLNDTIWCCIKHKFHAKTGSNQ